MSALGEYKFILKLDPIDGLHMSDYDFECALYVYTNRKVVIPKSKMIKVDDDSYKVVANSIDVMRIGKGKINAEITAFIPDSDFDDGFRTEKLILCTKVTAIEDAFRVLSPV